MKVIHVLKKIEQIDDDVRELRKMEKSLQRNKSFTTPICMTIEKQINNLLGDKNKSEQAKVVGIELAKKATAKGIENVVFDRGGYLYIGRVQSLADGARAGGLKF